MNRLRRLAKGQLCQIRLAGICNFKKETTVLCHFRLVDHSGIGLKNDDQCGAWGCSDCHLYVDTHHDAETQLAFAHGVFRTQRILRDQHGELIEYSQGN
jgi:hypothetical protein